MEQTVTESANRRIGKYEVVGELGHGGMAVVYRARDTQLLRDVAVKVLHPHLATDPESRQRFLREAQAAARLKHPNIVEVYDFSVETDRESFMVSELLEGPTLRRFAEQHPGMPSEVAAAIGMVLCDALTCAHSQGVIHRDVKPDNILLQTGGVLKLTDFGIAHVADGGGMTVTGQVLGSPAHMAPEQIEGRRIDARADLFAAGTVLYALAVGRLPFEASHPHALLRKILESEYPDPLRAAPVVGHRFATIIRKCLEREPEKRYADAAALKSALKEFLADMGWPSIDATLKNYFADPEAFAKSHRETLLERLPEWGVKARKNGSIPDALGFFNRALAMDPSNQRVLALVRGISRRRRIRKAMTAAAIVCVTAVASAILMVGIVHKLRSGPRHRLVPATQLSASIEHIHWIPTTARMGVTPGVAAPVVAAVAQPNASPVVAPMHRVLRPTAAPVATVVAHRGTREVSIRANPPGSSYSIDGGPVVSYSVPVHMTMALGTHLFRLVPSVASCEDKSWRLDIHPRTPDETTDTQQISLVILCGDDGPAAPRATVAVP